MWRPVWTVNGVERVVRLLIYRLWRSRLACRVLIWMEITYAQCIRHVPQYVAGINPMKFAI